MTKLSIIVPVYNVEKYLEKCIDSILHQKFHEFEIILVDDGSKDSSGILCEEYAKHDNRIIVKHKQNGGQSSARNLGLEIAMGEYIGFVDSDDWIHEDMYEILMNNAERKNYDIVACNIMMMKSTGTFNPINKSSSNQEFNRVSAMNEIYKNKILTFSPCNKIYKRELFTGLRFVEGIILEDKDISYKLVDKSENIFYTNDILYY